MANLESSVGWRAGRRLLFWGGAAALTAGVLLHLPMYGESLHAGHHMSDMPLDPWMIVGMLLVVLGTAAAFLGAMPERRRRAPEGATRRRYEAPDETRLGSAHILALLVLTIGLVIDTMKPATLGFVLPGLAQEYGIDRSSAALLPFVALSGTVVGSIIWGYLADFYGRRVSIILSTLVFMATSVCGAMPSFSLNLLMCFLMGASAGGMMPVVYTLLAEIMPPRSRSWILVLIGGTGLAGGYLAASFVAAVFEPVFGWRSLWLQGLPTGVLLLLMARLIPESPEFLLSQGRDEELHKLGRKYGIVPAPVSVPVTSPGVTQDHRRLTAALVIAGLAWSFVNFGILLWLPMDLQDRGLSSALASGVVAKSALIALPTIALAALFYSRWSSKWTLVGSILLTALSLAGTLLLDEVSSSSFLLISVVAMLIVGSNATIAVLLPYAAENYRLGVRGRGTGVIAGASKLGGVGIQGSALMGIVPSFGGTALLLIVPMAFSALLLAYLGPETRGRSLRELEEATA